MEKYLEEAGKKYTDALKELPDIHPYKGAVLPYTNTKTFPDATNNLLHEINGRNKSKIFDLIKDNHEKHKDVVNYITKILQYNDITDEYNPPNDDVVEFVNLSDIKIIPELSDFTEPSDLDIYIAFLFALCLHANSANDIKNDEIKNTIKNRLEEVQKIMLKNQMLLCFYESSDMTGFLTDTQHYTYTDANTNETKTYEPINELVNIVFNIFLNEKNEQITENINIINKQVDGANAIILEGNKQDGGKKQKPTKTKRRKTRKTKKTRKNKRKKPKKRSRK
jgi:hypothetical protein